MSGSPTTALGSSCPQRRIRRHRSRSCCAMLARRKCAVPRRALLIAALTLLSACDPDTVVHKVGWFATMRHQRNIKPYARPIPPVEGAVPVAGAELPLTRELADRLANPRTRTAESLNRGEWVFQTYCQVCHGGGGRRGRPRCRGGAVP